MNLGMNSFFSVFLLLGYSCQQMPQGTLNYTQLSYDTNTISIFSWDTTKYVFPKNSDPLPLTQEDLYLIDSLLADAIDSFNSKMSPAYFESFNKIVPIDSTQTSSGVIKGTLTSEFTIDKKGKLRYDALMFVADGYYNNQCKATWTSYKTSTSKKCNWGDFRMPDSKELDSGAGDVSINEKFIKNGWQTFVDAYSANTDKAKKALEIEHRKWWE